MDVIHGVCLDGGVSWPPSGSRDAYLVGSDFFAILTILILLLGKNHFINVSRVFGWGKAGRAVLDLELDNIYLGVTYLATGVFCTIYSRHDDNASKSVL